MKIVVTLLLIIVLVSLMGIYFIPFDSVDFGTKSANYNSTLLKGEKTMQFYQNMRFPDEQISYKILDCPLQKQDDMEYAFSIVEENTLLRFYPVEDSEEISISCQDKDIFHDGLFIAGEGGPTNITVAGELSVIERGTILLIRESTCPKPNIALHELFHVLGFGHSINPENIMYNISKCDQTIGEDMLQTINVLYSIPSKPDLTVENISAVMHGRFLSMNLTIRNVGLQDAGKSTVRIYAKENIVKELDLDSLPIGTGRIIKMENIFVSQIMVKELELSIDNNFSEISKDNNRIKLEIE